MVLIVADQYGALFDGLQGAHAPVDNVDGPEMMLLDSLVSDLWGKLEHCRRARHDRDESMLRSMQQRNAQYSDAMMAALNQQNRSKTYFPSVDLKTETADAKLSAVFTLGATPPFGFSASKDPVLPVDVVRTVQQRVAVRARQVIEQTQGQVMMDQAMLSWLKESVYLDVQNELRREAEARAKRNERTVRDTIEEGGIQAALKGAITNGCTFDAGFVRVLPRMEPRLHYGPTGPTVADELVEHLESVHPLHVYPEPGIEDLDDGYVFLWRRRNRAEMAQFFGVPGVRTDALNRVLSGRGAEISSSQEDALERRKQILERKGSEVEQLRDWFDVYNYHGTVRGKDLKEWGWEAAYGPAPFDDEDAVECQAWLVDGEVIKVALNEHPLKLKPIFKWTFRKVPGAFWGKGVPEILRPVEGAYNATIRHLQNNLAIASGPQVVVNASSVRNDLAPSKMRPWMLWEVTQDPYGQQRPPVEFFQPDTRAHEMMAVASFFDSYMDVMVGIPSYMGGDTDLKGAGRTSGGLHQLRQEAGVILQHSAASIDDMVRRCTLWHFTTLMVSGRIPVEDQGDLRVVPHGTAKLAEQEQNAHNIVGFLQATANEWDIQIIGPEGRRALLAEAAKALKVNFESLVVPTKADASLGQMLAPPPAGPGGGMPATGGGGPGGEAPQSQPAGGPQPGGPQG